MKGESMMGASAAHRENLAMVRTSRGAFIGLAAVQLLADWGLAAMRPLGKPVDCRADGGGSELVMGPRAYLLPKDTSFDAARRLVGAAQIAP
jgi:hypothetical protein